MKHYKGECTSYSINELSEKAKERAYSKWECDDYYIWGKEVEATLDEFCKVFDIKMHDWSYDSCSSDYAFRIENDVLDDTEADIKGIRLAVYIWNNYAKYITKGKYYSLWCKREKSEHNPNVGKLKTRYSKVMTQMDNCPLTGWCFDYEILDSIIKCLTYKKMYDSYKELVDECLSNFFDACVKDCQYCESMEYFIDMAEANDYEYDEYGNEFYLPKGFEEVA